MQLPATTHILVVGAGPTGLATAISLVLKGLKPEDIVIVDSVIKGENTSRAMAIHAATLEALDTIGCADKIVQAGLQARNMHIRHRASPFISNDFSYLDTHTKFPFVLLLSQAITEQILWDRLTELGVEIIRPRRVVGMKPNDDKGLDVTFESGEVLTASYVIGADGAKSAVRNLSGIGFIDPSGFIVKQSVSNRVAQLVLGDVTFDSPVNPEDTAGTVSTAGMCLVLPLGSPSASSMVYGSAEPVYRIVMNVLLTDGPPPSNPSLEYLQACLNKQGPLALSSDPSTNPKPVKITKVFWSSRFRTHSAVADAFFKHIPGQGEEAGGIVMLVGDAAHIHSPVGGQGMNLGLRDAIGLGAVIVEHVGANDKTDACLSPLRDFAFTRRKRALNVIHLTKTGLTVMSLVMTSTLASWLMSLLWMIPAVKKRAVWQLSGLGNK